jgi:hypothetical protein
LIFLHGAGKTRIPDIDYTLLPNEGTATIAGFDGDHKSNRSSSIVYGKFFVSDFDQPKI